METRKESDVTVNKKKDNDTDVTETLSALFDRFGKILSEKIRDADRSINREVRIARLSQERKKLLYALGEKVYERTKGETNEPLILRLETIDKDIAKLETQPEA